VIILLIPVPATTVENGQLSGIVTVQEKVLSVRQSYF